VDRFIKKSFVTQFDNLCSEFKKVNHIMFGR